MDCLVKSCIFDLQNVIDEIEKLEEEKQRFMSIIENHFDNESNVMKCMEIYKAIPDCELRFDLFVKLKKITEEMNKRIAKEHGVKMHLSPSNLEKVVNDAVQFCKDDYDEVNVRTGTPEVDVDFK